MIYVLNNNFDYVGTLPSFLRDFNSISLLNITNKVNNFGL